MLKEIKKIIVEKKSFLKEEDIKLETKLKEDLGLDSFDAFELVIELEKRFFLKISDEAVNQFKTIGDVVEYLKKNIIDSEK
ncbi:acyl carrier protein [Texas Phoenix palm phytoplasma]|uniref:Acyl carrier protein n=1 Tax=Texas Phoenix palm phytoplasma TaxID=176709 RepID=A0ABS5BIK9_9MOLU|nr:acyl carrier protein [Texas Phoenix palm phytoplasma]